MADVYLNRWILIRYGGHGPIFVMLKDGSALSIGYKDYMNAHEIFDEIMCFETQVDAYKYRNERMFVPPSDDCCIDHMVSTMTASSLDFLRGEIKRRVLR